VVEQLHSEDHVRQYLARIFPSQNFAAIIPFESGWVCRPKLTAREIAEGQGLGLGNYVVNRGTGVVTAHASLPPFTIGEMYDEAIRTGRPVQGGQIYPHLVRISIQRVQEDSATIHYRVRTESLAQPPAPPTDFQLTVDKNTLSFQPGGAMAANAASWAQWRFRQDGSWPESGTWED